LLKVNKLSKIGGFSKVTQTYSAGRNQTGLLILVGDGWSNFLHLPPRKPLLCNGFYVLVAVWQTFSQKKSKKKER
jgi:hypothetical protein